MKGAETGQNERRLSDYQNFSGRKQDDKATDRRYSSIERINPRAELQVQRQRLHPWAKRPELQA